MQCRPANTPTSIHPSLQIGIPAFIADREDVFQLYFVTVTPIPQILTAPGKMQVRFVSRRQTACCIHSVATLRKNAMSHVPHV